MKTNLRFVVDSGIIAALYAVITWILPIASYGPLQFRFSEILTLLAFYNPAFIPGLSLGCLLANLPSPFGVYDVIFGTLATFLSLLAMKKSKKLFIASLMPGIFNGLIIGLEIYFLTGAKDSFWLLGAQVFLSEFLIVSIIGVGIFHHLERNTVFMDKIKSLMN
ncbi:MAG: QueT transporter family protein [Tissierellia bacterium]|nr:QueT transporter family protein [Tissierellia bacterium]